MRSISLDGRYKLYTFEAGSAPESPLGLTGEYIDADVPGNVELDYMRAGLLPDLYAENNMALSAGLENKDFWYVRTFDLPAGERPDRAYLRFAGTDTVAEYFLNGVRIGDSDNMFIAHRFYAGDALCTGENQLAVHIRSAVEYAKRFEIRPYNVAFSGCYESLHVRKAAHSYGWDILPRAVSAGLWKSVTLEWEDEAEIRNVYIATTSVYEDVAVLVVSLNATLPDSVLGRCRLHIAGRCYDSTFSEEYPFAFTGCTVYPYVRSPRLWYPTGMGEQNLYDVSLRIVCDGAVVAAKNVRFGIRKAQLLYGETVGIEGDFRLLVNGRTVRCRGANWVPLDVFHSRDRAKYAQAVQEYVDANCNIVRVWGGGVYEDDEFFDLCDQKGIMVWQDIMLACHAYPTDDRFVGQMRAECAAVAERIRNHPSLVFYCGSNETDWAYVCVGLDPNDDRLTRDVIPKTLAAYDPFRDYLPSTPYFSRTFFQEHGGRFYLDLNEIEQVRACLPQEHYWWHRDDFMAFAGQTHRFIAEIGYSGCPSPDSLGRFLPIGAAFADDGAWRGHSFPTESARDTGIRYLFRNVPDSDADRIAASAYYQAEAYKFVAETARTDERNNGIILWNMRDGFPVFASSLVDFYGSKKPAFYAVRGAYEPRQCIITLSSGRYVAYVVDDLAVPAEARVAITDQAGRTLFDGTVTLSGACLTRVAEGRLTGEKLLLTRLTVGDRTVENYRYVWHTTIDYPEYDRLYRSAIGRVTGAIPGDGGSAKATAQKDRIQGNTDTVIG